MSRHKPSDPLGGHVRLYWTLLDSPAYLALSNAARALYVDLRRKLGATNNGNIECVLSDLRHRGWRSAHTVHNALQELLVVGLLAKTRQGGLTFGSKFCSLYRFTDQDVYAHPKLGIPASKATHDYRVLETLGHARAALRDLRNARKAAAPAKKSKVQKLHRIAAETASKAVLSDAETAHVAKLPMQKLHATAGGA